MQQKIVRKLRDGRVLVTSPMGDRYWIAQPNGSQNQVSIQEAVALMSLEAAPGNEKEVNQPYDLSRLKTKRRKRTTKKPPKGSGHESGLDLGDLTDAVRAATARFGGRNEDLEGDPSPDLLRKAKEIQESILDTTVDKNTRDFRRVFYQGLAKAWRGREDKKKGDPK